MEGGVCDTPGLVQPTLGGAENHVHPWMTEIDDGGVHGNYCAP